jgi:hypothetical protein
MWKAKQYFPSLSLKTSMLLGTGSGALSERYPLHIGSFYLNTAGIQVLLDYQDSDIDLAGIVSCCDNRGSLPLYWAAGGPGRIEEDYELAGRDITLQTISIFKLLLGLEPTSINAQDDQGETALFWATRNHGQGGRKHLDPAMCSRKDALRELA